MLMPVKTMTNLDPKVEWKTITPDMAGQWLQRNIELNRKVKNRNIEKMARDMTAGKWRLNGSAIVFNVSGQLVDGQHRLRAVVESGATIRSLVAWGVPDDAFPTIDQGAKRTGGDTLHTLGMPDTNVLAGATQLLWRDISGVSLFQGNYAPSNQDLVETVAANPDVHEAVKLARQAFKLLPPSVAVWLAWRFNKVDPAKAEEFFAILTSGEGLKKGDARYHLRETLLANKRGNARWKREYMAALSIKAWNAFRQNRNVFLLKFMKDEAWPEIV